MRTLQIWQTYHDEKQLQEYNLVETDVVRLFAGNDVLLQGENINALNRFYAEICALFYVWKNVIKSSFVGFCHYRREFPIVLDLDKGQCQVLAINHNTPVFAQYKQAHNYQDMYDVIDILNAQYGDGNKYSMYLLHGNTFIPFCSFIMSYEDFDSLCKWLFPILFAWDEKNKLGMNPAKYMEKTCWDFRYGDVNYQCRAIAFLSERLISCYIITEMTPFCISC